MRFGYRCDERPVYVSGSPHTVGPAFAPGAQALRRFMQGIRRTGQSPDAGLENIAYRRPAERYAQQPPSLLDDLDDLDDLRVHRAPGGAARCPECLQAECVAAEDDDDADDTVPGVQRVRLRAGQAGHFQHAEVDALTVRGKHPTSTTGSP
ncbi:MULTISPECIES: hypothetical protein [Streptomyces]|uniref:Uncharacterized protein n=2 Tax=Streptomyces TaxID=1883 RepID=A0ABV9IW71_9ACTN